MAKLAKSVISMRLEDGNELIQDQYEAEGGPPGASANQLQSVV
jgi:hypothetical protein